MKKYLIASFLIGAAISTAEAQTSRATFTAPVAEERRERTERTAPVTRTREVGAVPRAVRGGNPLLMFAPVAPARYYGPPEETVAPETESYDRRSNPNRMTGVILFGVRW